MSWNSPKNDLVTNFLKLENHILRMSAFSIGTFKQIFDVPFINNLFISFHNLFISLIELKNIH